MLWIGTLGVIVSAVGAAAGQEAALSRAYVGHKNDADMAAFIRQYRTCSGTRLDDCVTCHRGGIKGTDTEREFSPCGYCHLLVYPNPKYSTGVPRSAMDTLNAYGLDYRKAGRTREALAAISGLDSDRDGFSNDAEILDLRNPGDPASRPGPQVGHAAWVLEVATAPYNKAMKPTHFAASRRLLAQASRRGSRAGYRHRCTDDQN